MSEDDNDGKYIEFRDSVAWAPLHSSEKQEDFQQIIEELDIPEEYVGDIENWVETQVMLGMKQFIKRFTSILAKSLHGFCVLRALGYHVHINHKGRPVKSLRQISDHFKCSHQLIHQLTKDFQKQLNIEGAKSNEIETRTYSMNVVPPKGWITLGNAVKKYNVTRRYLLKYIDKNGIELKSYKRNSRIVKAKDILPLEGKKKRKYEKRI